VPLVTALGCCRQSHPHVQAPRADPSPALDCTKRREVPAPPTSTCPPAGAMATPCNADPQRPHQGPGPRPWPRKGQQSGFTRPCRRPLPAGGPVEHQAHSRPGSWGRSPMGQGVGEGEPGPGRGHRCRPSGGGAGRSTTCADLSRHLRRPCDARLSPLNAELARATSSSACRASNQQAVVFGAAAPSPIAPPVAPVPPPAPEAPSTTRCWQLVRGS